MDPLLHAIVFVGSNVLFFLIHRYYENRIDHLKRATFVGEIAPQIFEKKQIGAEIPSRVASTVHATIVGYMCLYLIATLPEWRANAYDAKFVPPSLFYLFNFSISYFIQDTRLVYATKLEPYIPMLIHHVVSISSLLLCFYVPEGAFYGALMFVTECATIFHNGFFFTDLIEQVWRAKKIDKQETEKAANAKTQKQFWKWTKKVIGWLYVLAWLAFRTAGLNSYIFYRWYIDWEIGHAVLPLFFRVYTMPIVLLLMGGNTRYLFERGVGSPLPDIMFGPVSTDQKKKV